MKPIAPALVPVSPLPVLAVDERLGMSVEGGDRAALLAAIDHSLVYLKTPKAEAAYRQYPVAGITRERVQRSLERFRNLLVTVPSAQVLQAIVQREFVFYRSVGKDGYGRVDFTGYFEPEYLASRTRTLTYRYPLFRLPPDLKQWPDPHPTRLDLEGADGLQFDKGRLKGLELVWLRDRMEAFLIQVQGSARLSLTDGGVMTVGYAGQIKQPYRSIGRELVNDGKLSANNLSLPNVLAYFKRYPAELNVYLPRNPSFVFFRDTQGSPATGSLGLPVTRERSIATDKKVFPPGALALIRTALPFLTQTGTWKSQVVNRYVLDQDTGGAIVGAGRVDLFMGTGKQAGDRAGVINTPGALYYLLLR